MKMLTISPRKHYVSAYADDICISHKGFDSLASALAEYAKHVESSVDFFASKAMASFNGNANFNPQDKAPDRVIFWKGTRKKPFAEYVAQDLEFNGSRFVPRETKPV